MARAFHALLLAAPLLFAGCERLRGPSTGPSAASGNLEEGKRLYLTACASCHGVNGSGELLRPMYPKLGDLGSAELQGRLDDAELTALIASGREKMPGFGTIYSRDQLASLVAFVRTLKK
jgi:mono/diheme cytochrome c family protein